jgi:hypothetical protein
MNQPDVVEVRYDCQCGCKPRARYQRGSDEAVHEQCCCGRVHFVGTDALQKLETYVQEERRGETYSLTLQQVTAPWGEDIPVAFGLPQEPHHH